MALSRTMHACRPTPALQQVASRTAGQALAGSAMVEYSSPETNKVNARLTSGNNYPVTISQNSKHELGNEGASRVYRYTGVADARQHAHPRQPGAKPQRKLRRLSLLSTLPLYSIVTQKPAGCRQSFQQDGGGGGRQDSRAATSTPTKSLSAPLTGALLWPTKVPWPNTVTL